MASFPSPFSDSDNDIFDEYDEFTPEYIPEPGPFLKDHDVLTGEQHVTLHKLTKEFFEERGVYDMTFGYNLARLNLDHRHSDAGYRYAEEVNDRSILRAEFTPTTPFCPQSHTLTIGSFRAWNREIDRLDYGLVRVHVHPMHHQSAAINEQLDEFEAKYLETGSVRVMLEDSRIESNPMEQAMREDEPSRGPQSPF
jgi:hypothetical protein